MRSQKTGPKKPVAQRHLTTHSLLRRPATARKGTGFLHAEDAHNLAGADHDGDKDDNIQEEDSMMLSWSAVLDFASIQQACDEEPRAVSFATFATSAEARACSKKQFRSLRLSMVVISCRWCSLDDFCGFLLLNMSARLAFWPWH